MKNILQAIKSCLNGLRMYVDKTVKPLEDAAYANSDWNQNDETAVDYIKNRPFYKVPDVIGATVLEECTLELSQAEGYNNGNYTIYRWDVDFPYADHPEISEDTFGSLFKVVWDGEEYYCTSKDDNTEMYCLGNTHYNSKRCENTGEPFLIMFDIWFGTQTVAILTNSAESSHSIAIYAITEQGEFKRLDSKYLPESSASKSDVSKVRAIADNAQTAADNAQTTAETAQTAADNANATKMDATNPAGTGVFSINRSKQGEVGSYSVAIGNGTQATRRSQIATGAYNKPGSYALVHHRNNNADTLDGTSFYCSDKYFLDCHTGMFKFINPKSLTFADMPIGYFFMEGTLAIAGAVIYKKSSDTIYASIRIASQTPSDRGHYLHMIGNGTSDTTRSNAHTLDWEGNAWYAGDVYVGSTSGTNKDEGSRKLATEAYVDGKIAKFKSESSTSAYTNQLLLATDTDRTTIYDGDGYIDAYRLSSSGGVITHYGMSATGFIPATPGQTIRIKGAVPMQGQNNYIITYNADNTVSKYASMAYDSTGWITPADGWMQYEDGVIIIPLTSELFGSDFNAVRFCSAQLSDDVIVTVDEEIVDSYVQPDWNQSDLTAPDYVKNRTHYKAQQINQTLYPTETIDVEGLGAGTHLIFKPANTTPFLTLYSFTNMRYGNNCAFGYEYEYIRVSDNSYVTNSITPEGLFGNTKYKLIDSKNYSFPGVIGTVFVILDINTLTEENTKLFPEIGIYLQIQTDSTKANRTFTLKVFYMSKLSEIYVPGTIARTADVIPLPSTASVGQTIKVSAVDENGKPTAWEAVDITKSYEYLIDLTEDVESIDFDFTDSEGKPIMLNEILIVLHIKSINRSGCDTTLKYRMENGTDKTIWISNNYANAEGNWVLGSSFAKIQGRTIYCISNKNVNASGTVPYNSTGTNGVGIYQPHSGWGDRWMEGNLKPIGITGVKIPGAMGAKSQIYIYGVKV